MGVAKNSICEKQKIGTGTKEWIVTRVECRALARRGVLFLGDTDAASGYAFVRTAPRMSVLFACHDGGGEFLDNGRWRPFRPGDVAIVPAGVPHAYRTAARSMWRFSWVAYEDSLASPAFLKVREPLFLAGDALPLRWAVLGLHREVGSNADPAVEEQWCGLIDLHVLRLAKGARPIDDRLVRLWEAVEAEPARSWDGRSLARLAGLGPEQVRHLSNMHYGASPMARVARIRMRKAAALLLRDAGKLDEVAAAVGYRDVFAFSVAFKRIMGESPSMYKKRLRES